MTDREKLTDVIYSMDICSWDWAGKIADHLLANGVTFATDNNVGNKWIPVSERLPEKMMQCVCQYVFGDITEYPFYSVMWYFANDKVPHFQNEGSIGLRVTHWMPLPEPPKENDNG